MSITLQCLVTRLTGTATPKSDASDAIHLFTTESGTFVPKPLALVCQKGELVKKQWQLVALLAGIVLVLSPSCRNSCQQFAKLLVRFGVN